MIVVVDRFYKGETYTVGKLYVDGEYICQTLEDKDRNLFQGQGEKYILEHKVQDETAIPRGRYEITLDIESPAFGAKKYYKEFCDGKLPRLIDVPGFSGILMHRGANKDHTSGCILLGDNTSKGKLTNSQARFEQVYNLMKKAADKGEKIWISIS